MSERHASRAPPLATVRELVERSLGYAAAKKRPICAFVDYEDGRQGAALTIYRLLGGRCDAEPQGIELLERLDNQRRTINELQARVGMLNERIMLMQSARARQGTP